MTPPANPERLAEVLAEIVAVVKDQLAPASALLSKANLAIVLGTTEPTVDRMRAAGKLGPVPFRIGGLKWDRGEILAWIANPVRPGELADAKQWPAIKESLAKRNR
jgi:predicted DNA-binding transcriptional regulator AlpA